MGGTGARSADSVGTAIASAAMGAPGLVALTLTVSAVVFDDAAWAVAAAFLAGALLRESDRGHWVVVGIAAGLFFTRAAWCLDSDVDGRRLVVWGAAIVAFGAPFLRGCLARTAALAFVGVGFAVMSTSWTPALRAGRTEPEVLLAAGALLATCLADGRRVVAARTAVLVTAAVYLLLRVKALADAPLADTVTSIALLAAAPVAGATAAELDEGARPDGGVRLVVLCQRHAWATSALLGLAIAAVAGPWCLERKGPGSDGDFLCALPLLVTTSAALVHVGRGARTTIDRLAPWLGANVAVAATAAAWTAHFPNASPIGRAAVVGFVAALLLWPLASAAILPDSPPGDVAETAAPAFTAALFLLPLVGTFFDDSTWWFGALLGLAVAPLAFHAAVRTRLPTRGMLVVALALGVAWDVERPEVWHREGGRPPYSHVLTVGVWLLAGLLVVAARRCRQMTAVPREHPVLADFGGA